MQGKFYLVRDIWPEDDRLQTLEKYSAPNVREATGGYPVYGLGQPTYEGLTGFMQALKDSGKQVKSSPRRVSIYLFIIYLI